MKNFSLNDEETSDIRTNTYSNISSKYKTTLLDNDNDIKTKRILIENNDKENFDYNSSSNNIESEIENDIKNYYKKQNRKIDKIENYLIQLKKFGYPDIGKIYLSNDLNEIKKACNFFEFLIQKEIKLKNVNFDFQIKTLKKQLNIEFKKNLKLKKEIEIKIQKQNEYLEENKTLKSMVNKLNSEKNNLSETLNKFEAMKSIIINAFETMDYVQTNDMSKMLSRVKDAEKLIKALKYGYDESLKELTKEMNILKKFILELNIEFCNILDKSINIDENIFNFSFSDSFDLIKETFKGNLKHLKQLLYNIKILNTQSNKNFEEEDDISLKKTDTKCSSIYFNEKRRSKNKNYEINDNKFLNEDI